VAPQRAYGKRHTGGRAVSRGLRVLVVFARWQLSLFRQAGDKTGLFDLLYRAPVLGGTPKLLVRDVDAHPVFSPDSQRMIYIRCNNPEAQQVPLALGEPRRQRRTALHIKEGAIPNG